MCFICPVRGQRLKLRVLASRRRCLENASPASSARVREFISHDDRHVRQSLAVRLVLLTAEGLYVYPRFMSVLCLICKAVFKHKPSRGCVQYIFRRCPPLNDRSPGSDILSLYYTSFLSRCRLPTFRIFRRSTPLPPSHSRDYSLPDRKRRGYAPGSGFSSCSPQNYALLRFQNSCQAVFFQRDISFPRSLLLLVVS